MDPSTEKSEKKSVVFTILQKVGQPHPMTEPSYFIGYEPFAFNKWLCIGYDFFQAVLQKMVDTFFLEVPKG